MTKPKILIHNVSTNEIVEREMNEQELAEFEAKELANKTAKQDAATMADAKAALLAKLGITDDEAKLLLS
jgi:hypothetical protein